MNKLFLLISSVTLFAQIPVVSMDQKSFDQKKDRKRLRDVELEEPNKSLKLDADELELLGKILSENDKKELNSLLNSENNGEKKIKIEEKKVDISKLTDDDIKQISINAVNELEFGVGRERQSLNPTKSCIKKDELSASGDSYLQLDGVDELAGKTFEKIIDENKFQQMPLIVVRVSINGKEDYFDLKSIVNKYLSLDVGDTKIFSTKIHPTYKLVTDKQFDAFKPDFSSGMTYILNKKETDKLIGKYSDFMKEIGEQGDDHPYEISDAKIDENMSFFILPIDSDTLVYLGDESDVVADTKRGRSLRTIFRIYLKQKKYPAERLIFYEILRYLNPENSVFLTLGEEIGRKIQESCSEGDLSAAYQRAYYLTFKDDYSNALKSLKKGIELKDKKSLELQEEIENKLKELFEQAKNNDRSAQYIVIKYYFDQSKLGSNLTLMLDYLKQGLVSKDERFCKLAKTIGEKFNKSAQDGDINAGLVISYIATCLKDYATALKYLENGIKSQDANSLALQKIINERYTKLLEAAEKGEKIDYYQAAYYYYQNRDFYTAETYFKKITDTQDEKSLKLYQAIKNATQELNKKRALGDVSASYELAIYCYKRNEWAQALASLLKGIQLYDEKSVKLQQKINSEIIDLHRSYEKGDASAGNKLVDRYYYQKKDYYTALLFLKKGIVAKNETSLILENKIKQMLQGLVDKYNNEDDLSAGEQLAYYCYSLKDYNKALQYLAKGAQKEQVKALRMAAKIWYELEKNDLANDFIRRANEAEKNNKKE